MEIAFLILLIIIILLLVGFGVLFVFRILEVIEGLRKEVAEKSVEHREEIRGSLEQIKDKLAAGINDYSEKIKEQFRQSAGIIKEVTEKLTRLDETNKQVLDFSAQLQSLENILRNPKQRGILSEYWLETLLGNVLAPNQYKMQYKFKNGDLVDAVIFYRDRIIPIDAKFSLEKYNKIMEEVHEGQRAQLEKEFRMDLKNRIDETAKYIRPAENTTEFAFMFIPAEGVYYNLLIYKVGTIEISSQDLIEYAFKKHVIIVSPTSFFAYLETVIHGLKALAMEENVKEIIKKVSELARHLQSYESCMQKLGNSLGAAVNQYNQAYKEFMKVDKDIFKITEGESGGKVNPELLAP